MHKRKHNLTKKHSRFITILKHVKMLLNFKRGPETPALPTDSALRRLFRYRFSVTNRQLQKLRSKPSKRSL